MTEILTDRLDVLAVGPHPDDLEITCGGTLAKLVRQGYRVGMLDLTSGEPTPRGSEEIRVREAEAARQVLGVPLRLNARPAQPRADGRAGQPLRRSPRCSAAYGRASSSAWPAAPPPPRRTITRPICSSRPPASSRS